MLRLCFSADLFVAGGGARHRVSVRRGVTVLEVLFSIGIVAVGLLGVLIVVPLAGLRSTQGAIADGADRMGRNAIRAFDVCQMRRQDNWSQIDTGSGNYVAFNGAEAFCIDPLYMAANAGTVGIYRFPYLGTGAVPNTLPWMKRITLRSVPGAAVTSVMTATQAELIFLGDDDLVFSLPQDRTLPAVQKFDSAGLKRQWEGKFSWLATLVPKPGYSSDTYLLSIVVFHRRDPSAEAERTVDVNSFNSSGYNGGDVVLRADASGTPPAVEDDLKMKEGEWLMLAGIDDDVTPYRHYFQWYRVQTADAGPTEASSGIYDRDLTLFGQDWPIGVVDVTKAVWVPGVVAVYEKTIRLETSSLWTNF